MLAIDDLKKLAKMQELLLERTINDREENLEKYKKIVIQIDESSFSSFLDELNRINKHNQTLEEELQFLEQVRTSYQQLLEQQLGFKRVCELYRDTGLQLSDLSQINIEYIDSRISTINGYLINQKNIETNKNRLQQLNEELIKEEKNKDYLSNKLKELENSLRNNFINAEGRCIVDGELQYVSVVSEYEKLGIDFRGMLGDTDTSLEVLLSKTNEEVSAASEKLKAAEICFGAVPSAENKQILDDITSENIKVRYKESMVKILELLIRDIDNLDLFREKREKLLDLIKYRASSLSKLGINVSIDPFARTRISEQLDMVSSFEDNSKRIDGIKKEIAGLSQRVEEMTSQNMDYMIQLNDPKNLLVSRTSMNDIDISSVKWDEEYFEERPVLDNQVVNLRVLPKQFNNAIVKQKTSRVLRRVIEMVNSGSLTEEREDKSEVSSPELVIVPSSISIVEDEDRGEVIVETKEDVVVETMPELDDKPWSDSLTLQIDDTDKEDSDEQVQVLEIDDIFNAEKKDTDESQILNINDSDMFMTVDPFLETPLFTERVEEDVDELDEKDTDNLEVEMMTESTDVSVSDGNNDENFPFLETGEDVIEIDSSHEVVEEDIDQLEDEMPEAFWVTQEEEKVVDNNDVGLTFEQQVRELMSEESDVKTRKLVA